MGLKVATDNSVYQKARKTLKLLVVLNTTDSLGNRLNSSITTNLIFQNTSLRWWNESWIRRKPIFLMKPETLEEEMTQ